METRMLHCPNCGAPVAAIARFCTFCGGPLAPTPEVVQQDHEAQQVRRNAFVEALKTMLENATPAGEALQAASAAHLGSPLDQAIIHATLAIAKSAERSLKCPLMNDGNALSRILEAYERARPEALKNGSAELNLPYVGANERGPVHLNFLLERAAIPALESGGTVA